MTPRTTSMAFSAALAMSACTPGKTFIAGARDYDAYRETRIRATRAARLQADLDYLRDRPHGAYAEEVRADFADEEPRFYATHSSTLEGLEAYLDALPNGPHAVDARALIESKTTATDRPDALLAAASATRRRLEENARSRTRALAAFTTWVDALLTEGAFDASLARGPKEVVVPWSLGLPAPACTLLEPPEAGASRRCTKLVTADFVVPREKNYADRELLFDVTLELDARDVPLVATIAGPELFSRVDETYLDRATDEDEETRRAAAIARVIEIVSNSFDGHVSNDPACEQKDFRAPDVLHLRCKNVDVRATAGSGAGADDVIRVRPAR